MLAIRMQRTGRKGHAMFRVIVQDSRRTPTSGRVVAFLGHHDPHTKATELAKDKAAYYLEHGAQPSDRVVRLFQAEGIVMPAWVKSATVKTVAIRNPDKLRKNRPAEEVAPVEEPTEAPAAEEVAEAPAATEPVIETTETEVPVTETPAEESPEAEKPAK